MTTITERVASLEVKVELMSAQQKEIVTKLDELLTLKNKGLGMLMLISAIVGSGVLGFFSWVRGG